MPQDQDIQNTETLAESYAVFGNPIAQSKSPQIHQQFAEQTGQNISYEKFCVDVEGFNAAADEFFTQGGKGLNITMPFKLDAFNYADHLSERAKMAGAVNTLAKQADGSILGDTTDGIGLVRDITERLGWPIENKRLLVLGAGGAVRGVLLSILEKNPSCLVIANRTAQKAKDLAEAFSDSDIISGCGFEDLTGQSFDIIINGTSASLSGSIPPLADENFAPECTAYDMVYGKEETAFLIAAREKGVTKVADGLGMLVGQAAESFSIWRGVNPEIAPVFQRLREEM